MAEFQIYRKETKYHAHEAVIKWIVDISMVICISFLMAIYLMGKTTVVGHSMEPLLTTGDGVLIDKVSYTLDRPKRYDVIVFEPVVANVSKYYIKRIIGLPGETVQIIDGYVYINGQKLEDDIIFEYAREDKIKQDKEDKRNGIEYDPDAEPDYSSYLIYNAGLAKEPVTLGYDEYFVLGDNRNNSEDSRFSNVGVVKYSTIIGKIWAVSTPIGRMRIVK